MDTSVLQMLKGQQHAREFLERISKNPEGGFIFFGPDGVGKRTAAILFAAAVNPPSYSQDIFDLKVPDISPLFPFKAPPDTKTDKWLEDWGDEKEKYALNKISPVFPSSSVIPIGNKDKELVGTIRDLRREMRFPPRVLKKRVALLFDFDRIRESGANAFLKTLEEPQHDTVLILTTSRPFALLPTIRSRCKMVRFKELPDEVVREYLLNQGFDEEDAGIATDVAFGSLRQAFKYLADRDKFISENILDWLEKPSSSSVALGNLIDSLSWRVSLERIIHSFAVVFRWTLRARTGRHPSWKRLAGIVESISLNISTPSLVHNIMLTEKMASRVSLNPTPSLFLYSYLTSLKFN
ncbi:AAA family ATPase [candidate division WOR-3 bacterium]|nr:AAA family ATPase [candidate division WOR-3 bacterium]